MRAMARIIFALIIICLTLFCIHVEHLGLGPGDRQVYAIGVMQKIIGMVALSVTVLLYRRNFAQTLALAVVGVIWFAQQQVISTSSTSTPPQASVWLSGLMPVDTAYLCVTSSADDLFYIEGVAITEVFEQQSFADQDCNPRSEPRHIEILFAATFEPAGRDPLRERISQFIDKLLGVS